MLSAFGVIGFRSDFFFSKMDKEAGDQLCQHSLIKLEVHRGQPEEMIPSPEAVSLLFFK